MFQVIHIRVTFWIHNFWCHWKKSLSKKNI